MSSLLRAASFATLSVVLAAFAACGSNADEAPGSGGSGVGGSPTGGGGSGGAGGSGASGGSGGLIDTGLDDVVNLDSDAGCGQAQYKAKNTPLHLYIMMDKSSSMSGFKWDAAKAGLIAFVKDGESDGIYLGLKFFPRKADATPPCDQQAYTTPDTPFDTLPGNATPIETAINAESPNGLNTPTYPALGGAILKGIQIAQNNPGHSAAVLLVSDGVPQGPAALCSGVNPEDTAEIAKLAQTGATFNPPVPTYVIGLPGVDQTFANQVAQAGGSGSAILVSSTNVQQEFQDALAKIRGQALPCEFELPDEVSKGQVAYDKVNVFLTPGNGAPGVVLQTKDCAKGDGWHYDNASNPTKIILCPNVCAGLKKDYKAVVDIQLGCATQVVK